MCRIGLCWACRSGDHKHHQKVVRSVPKGMMGGVICGCKGDCGSEESKRERIAEARRMMGLKP